MGDNIRSILILGTRSLAVEMADLLSEIPGWRVAGFVENLDRERCRERRNNLPIHWIDTVAQLAEGHYAVCGISTTHRSRFIGQAIDQGLRFVPLMHPTCRISRTSTLGEGTFLSTGVIIASHTQLGRYVFVNRGALIGHHTTIEDYVTIQAGANIAGVCHVGEATYIGMGAVVTDRVRIGCHSVVGAGAVVTKDVPDNVQVVGVPARIVKQNIEGK